ncbi:MAG: CASTOR/POLLUX-related putative ion channel [Microcoleus sp.]
MGIPVCLAKGWSYRILTLIVTFGGVFSVSILIGLIVSGISEKVENLRKGRSRVLETDHIVILGWSVQVFTIISELAEANANQANTCIVILSEKDAVEMTDALRENLGKLPKVKLICRTGDPSSMADLGIVSIQTSRSIVILNSSEDRSDGAAIKTLLAIANIERELSKPYHIVTEVKNPRTINVLQSIAGDMVETVLVKDTIARILVQTSRQSGLSVVYTELLNFDGDEIYFHAEPNLAGRTYGDALFAYNDSTVIGIASSNGKVELNPPSDTLIEPGHRLVIISEDDDRMQLSGMSQLPVEYKAIKNASQVTPPQPENTLIRSDRVAFIIQELDRYAIAGSHLTIVTVFPEAELTLSGKSLNLQNLTLDYQQADATAREVLEGLNLQQYQQIIVVSNTEIDPDRADARTLVTLLHLREIAKRNQYKFRIVTEMLDTRNQALAQVAQPDDFVIGEQIISLMLTQIAEQKHLNSVFKELFDPDGSEIYLKPVSDYIHVDRPVNFYTLVEAARQRGESAIGYRLQVNASNKAKSYGIAINPQKDNSIEFTAEDRVIVLAEN